MSIFSLFSKRQKELRGEVSDVYSYDVIPHEFRVQVIHIWHDSLGYPSHYGDRFLGTFGAYKLLPKRFAANTVFFSSMKVQSTIVTIWLASLIFC
jgi:hypothetical protein